MRTLKVALLGIGQASLLGCGSPPRAERRLAVADSAALAPPAPVPAPPAAAAPQPEPFTTLPLLWVYAGGDAEPFCLELHQDGAGQFYGGFTAHNPVRWAYDSLSRRLDLTLSGLTAEHYVVLRDNLANHYIAGFDSASGTISYAIDPSSPELSVFNWLLVPRAWLADWQLRDARGGCPPLAGP